MYVVTTSHNYIGACIDSIMQDWFKLNLEDPSHVITMYSSYTLYYIFYANHWCCTDMEAVL